MSTKNEKLNKYIVQSYRDPYSGALYPIEKKEEFVKKLKAGAKKEKMRKMQAQRQQARSIVWQQAHQQVQSLEHLESWCRANVAQDIVEYYLQKEHCKKARTDSDNWSIPLLNTRKKICAYAITHSAPLGVETNWFLNKEKVAHKIALRCDTNTNLNSTVYSSSSNESGIRICNNEITLFADDWHFVQVLAISKYLSGQLIQERHPVSTFNEDLNRYAIERLGLSMSQLKGMQEIGLLAGDLDSKIKEMALLHSMKTTRAEPVILPDMDNTQSLHY